MMMMRLAVPFFLLVATACFLRAEKIDLPPQQLKNTATHVIVGVVEKVFERGESNDQWNTTFYVAEIRVKESQKGEGMKSGDLVYVRYWRRHWIGGSIPPPSTNGHRGLPKQGETLRIYMARNAYDGFGTTSDGGFNVIGANGFEKLTE